MHVLTARNVHCAIPEAIRHLTRVGIQRESRNGPVLVAPGPVATVYSHPMEKVEFWPVRDSNPIFHLMEALWMLGGRNDVAFPCLFNSTFGQFSDDGVTFNGAYGHRWRKHFGGFDQLRRVADALKANPDDRRQVISMWDGHHDPVLKDSKDVPCNTHVYVSRDHEGKLDITVCCRSNDVVWGCYGSNAVHFAFLLEYLAARIGCPTGRYTHISNNWHGYLKTIDPLRSLADSAPSGGHGDLDCWDPYENGLSTIPLIKEGEDVEQFDRDLSMFLDMGGMTPMGTRSKFLKKVAGPLAKAYNAFRTLGDPERFKESVKHAQDCEAEDWRIASVGWFQRREERARAKQTAATAD